MSDDFRKLNKSDFEFTQADEKIYDKKFETKPIGYFKDAMIRFRKNRTNVVATAILFLILLGTVIIPIVSTKNFTKLESELSFLPPRVPLLEKIGIMDGTSFKESIITDIQDPILDVYDGTLAEAEQAVIDAGLDVDHIVETTVKLARLMNVRTKLSDLEADDTVILIPTGLYMPVGYETRVIDMDSLKNFYVSCTEPNELCIGGTNALSVDPNSTKVTVLSVEYIQVDAIDNPELVITVPEFINNHNSTFNVYIKTTFAGEYELVGSLTEAGEFRVNIYDQFPTVTGTIVSKIKLELLATSKEDQIFIESIEVFNEGEDEPEFQDSGFELSNYTYATDDGASGLFLRYDGQMMMSSFRFFNYENALGRKIRTLPTSEYNQILEDYPDVCVKQDDDADPLNWYFLDGCPIFEVIFKHDDVQVGDELFSSYEVALDYGLYAGYDEAPYFIFGTDIEGRDLFTLLWVGTRTSLLVGFIVAAINISFGIVYGAISGYYGGTVDLILQRIAEVIGRIPWLVTLSIFVSLFGPGVMTLVLILIVSGWIGPASITRTQFYRYKGREYVLASRTLGAKDGRLIFRHILPNGIGTIITASILTIPYVIFAESTISYLGFGIGHGQEFNVFGLTFSGVSVGVLLSDGRLYLNEQPHLTIFPAILISILMITFNMFGNALRDAFNPALRGSE